jgi:hypothetical protein
VTKKVKPGDEIPASNATNTTPEHKKQTTRRQALRTLAGAGGVLAAGTVLPEKWTKPILDTVVVPAHAQATCVNTAEGSQTFTTATETAEATPFRVPDGVCQISVTALGGSGGGGGSGARNTAASLDGGDGFAGATAVTTFFVSTGDTLSVQVGGGAGVSGNAGSGGGGGLGGGEAGQSGTIGGAEIGGGGGGGSGGDSRVFAGATEYALALGGNGGDGSDAGGDPSGEGGLGSTEGVGVSPTGGSGGPGTDTFTGNPGTDGGAGSVVITW